MTFDRIQTKEICNSAESFKAMVVYFTLLSLPLRLCTANFPHAKNDFSKLSRRETNKRLRNENSRQSTTYCQHNFAPKEQVFNEQKLIISRRTKWYLHSLANLHILVHISNLNFRKIPLIRTKNTSTLDRNKIVDNARARNSLALPRSALTQSTVASLYCKIHFTFRKLIRWQTTSEKYYKIHFTFRK